MQRVRSHVSIVTTNRFQKIRHNEQHSDVKVITISKYDSKVAAIGYEKGIIYIVNVGDGSTAARLRGHDGDIQSFYFLKIILSQVQKIRQSEYGIKTMGQIFQH